MASISRRSIRFSFLLIFYVLLIQACVFSFLLRDNIYGAEASHPSSNSAQSDKFERTAFADNALYGQIRKRFKIEDALMAKVNYPPPHSPWMASQKEFYRSMLKGSTYDVLVVPFQTMANGIDLPGRMQMSYRLALSIEQNTKLKVAPLKLVYPALGAGARFYDEKEVLALGKMLGVSRIIWGYAGTRDFSNPKNIQFSFTIVDQSGGTEIEKSQISAKSWPYVDLDPEVLPFLSFDNSLDDVLDFLKMPRHTSSALAKLDQQNKFPVPISPAVLLNEKIDSPLYQGYILQMLANLAPTEYQRKALYTYSLISVFQVPKDDPDRKLIEARAYIHLYRRPAAIKAISGVASKEGKALMEYINANLPELEEKVNALDPSIKKLLAQFELFNLKDQYNKDLSDKEKEAFLSGYPEWHYFFAIALNNGDNWKRASNIELKLKLDQLFPVPGFTAKDIVMGYQLKNAGSVDRLEFELLFQKHIKFATTGLKDEMTAAENGTIFGPDLILMMLDSVGIYNLIQEVGFYSFTQDRPDEGLRICDKILRVYDGHPYFALYKAMSLSNTLDQRSAEEKGSIRNQAFMLALDAIWWNGCQNWLHSSARQYTFEIPKNEKFFINPKDSMWAIDSDYPFRTNNAGFQRRPEFMLLPWTHTNISYHKNVYERALLSRDFNLAKTIFSDLKSRFSGNPKKVHILASYKLIQPPPIPPEALKSGHGKPKWIKPGDIDPKHAFRDRRPFGPMSARVSTEDRKNIYLREVEAGSKDWKTYRDLAQIYIEEGNYRAAQEVMLKFPIIKHHDQYPSVQVSNVAYSAGQIFYWKGATDLARPFYQLSADLDTGSDPSMTSAERLAVLDLDFQTAAKCAYRRAQRYNSELAYNNTMEYMHLFGEHDAAWSLFNSLLSQFEDLTIWNSAVTGHRIQGTDTKELIDWMHKIARLNPAQKQNGYIAIFGIWSLVDHAPSPELIAAIQSFDVPPEGFMPNIWKHLSMNQKKSSSAVQKAKPPRLFYSAFAKAYDLLRQKKYNAAYNAFYNEMDYFGWGYDNPGQTLKSYLAWAGVKSSHAKTIEKKMIHIFNSSGFPRGREFDVELSYAAYEGGRGNHDKAVKYLKCAFACRYLDEDRLFSKWYQLVEMCQWLYDDSGDQRYRALALNWARAYQKIRPLEPWVYEVEFKLSNNRNDRIRALALFQKLNPSAKSISTIDDQLKKEAAQWMEKNNPFVIKPKGSNPTKT